MKFCSCGLQCYTNFSAVCHVLVLKETSMPKPLVFILIAIVLSVAGFLAYMQTRLLL